MVVTSGLRTNPVFVQETGLDRHDVLAAVYGAEKLEGSAELRDFLGAIADGVFHGVVQGMRLISPLSVKM
jgi:hypothetical protein